MKQKTRNKKNRIGLKLKKAVQNLHIDVFGYEPKVTTNIQSYFTTLSKDTGIPKERLVVRIFRDSPAMRVAVYYHGTAVKDISLQELVFLFTNSTPNGLFNMEDTVRDGMHRFMQEFSQTHAVDVDRLHICISTNIDAVRIRSYDGTKAIQDIPLKVLIKHFMK